MSRRFAGAWFVFTLAISITHTSAQSGKVPPTQVVITAAAVDGRFVQISGVNFGASPAVFLGGVPLDGVAVNAAGTGIVALDPGLAPGTYLLHVSTGNGQPQNGTFNLTLGAVGPMGPKGNDGTNGIDGKDGRDGEDGADGAQGPQGPPGPPLASLAALAGVPCTVDTQVGTVTISTASDGTISFRCVVPPPPTPPTEVDSNWLPWDMAEKYFTRFRQFEFPAQTSLPFPPSCFGDANGGSGTGGCLGQPSSTLSMSTMFQGLELAFSGDPTPLGQIGQFMVQWRFSMAGTLPFEYQIFGVSGSCNIAVNAPDVITQLFFEFDRLTDATQDIIRLTKFENVQTNIDLGGCDALFPVFGDLVVASIQSHIASFTIPEALASTIVCRPRGSETFAACAP